MDFLKKISSNFYVLFGLFFAIWMVFIDANDIVSQYRSKSRLEELEDERDFYLNKIEDVKTDREALTNDDALLEKFARERYFMKKSHEDIYLIVEE